ncbi:molybdopterin molybdotransferase MoeA [Methylomagnum sp.]
MHQEPDRCAEPAPKRLTLERALELMLAALRPVEGVEWLPLKQIQGRVLAETVHTPLDLPPFDNSAMDGYVLRVADLEDAVPLRVIGTSWAGRPFVGTLAPGECVRIFTGALVPDSADAVVAQEDVSREGDEISLTAPVRAGKHIRYQGEELRVGDELLPVGKRLAPADIGLLASVGLAEVPVKRRLRVAVLSTGDELRPVGESLGLGEIHDSNRYVLHALLAELGVDALDFGTLPDDPAALERGLLDISKQSDVILTTGGASVGDADFVVEVLRAIGRVDFWKVAIKSGKPFAFGQIGPAWLFGLPGNPAAAMITFRQLVRPALLTLMGAPVAAPLRLPATCANPLKKSPGRLEFQRGVFSRNAGGGLTVTGLAGQGSHRLSSMSRANCFIVLPLENAGVEPGDTVEIEPFGEF